MSVIFLHARFYPTVVVSTAIFFLFAGAGTLIGNCKPSQLKIKNMPDGETQSSGEGNRLPDYVVFKDPLSVDSLPPTVLTTRAQELKFPLQQEDKRDIETLISKFDQEKNCSGLAAPQIGISKQVIVFEVLSSPEMRRWRPDLIQQMPKSVWINPTYEAIDPSDLHEDYEGCFSVENVAAAVPRYKKIQYRAYSRDGELIEGRAEGFLARVIQHEIDHVHGILYLQRARLEDILPIGEYRKKREALMRGIDENAE